MWCGSLTAVHVLIATDADYMVDDVTAALGGPDVSFTVCRDGRQVADLVLQRSHDLAVLDLQSGSMGAMAVTMSLRLDESAGRLPRTNVLMLLDRAADVHLAKRCAADGWLVKPLDALGLQRAAEAILHPPAADEPAVDADHEADGVPVDELAEEEPATSG